MINGTVQSGRAVKMETHNKKIQIPNRIEIERQFLLHEETRNNIIKDFTERVELILSTLSFRPDIRGRVKSFDSYYKKILRYLKNDGDIPLITDTMGVRIVCPFAEDLDAVEDLILRNVTVIEVERKGRDDDVKEFGYESNHLLVKIPPDILYKWGNTDFDVAEIQIRTHLQNAWAEVEHELLYKTEFNPCDKPMRRKLAAIKASLSLGDLIFQEIRSYQRLLNGELGKRRESFFQKIEEASDAFLYNSESDLPPRPSPQALIANAPGYVPGSKDDLLLLALNAHNRSSFDEAIDLYSEILKLRPDTNTESVIFKHRGMAYFAQSKYEQAIKDFTRVVSLDKKAYKAFYFRGVVRSVMQDYSKAVDDFSRALKINPFHSFCLFRRGQAYYHLGDYPQAMSDCDASLSIEPHNEIVMKFKKFLTQKLKM